MKAWSACLTTSSPRGDIVKKYLLNKQGNKSALSSAVVRECSNNSYIASAKSYYVNRGVFSSQVKDFLKISLTEFYKHLEPGTLFKIADYLGLSKDSRFSTLLVKLNATPSYPIYNVAGSVLGLFTIKDAAKVIESPYGLAILRPDLYYNNLLELLNVNIKIEGAVTDYNYVNVLIADTRELINALKQLYYVYDIRLFAYQITQVVNGKIRSKTTPSIDISMFGYYSGLLAQADDVMVVVKDEGGDRYEIRDYVLQEMPHAVFLSHNVYSIHRSDIEKHANAQSDMPLLESEQRYSTELSRYHASRPSVYYKQCEISKLSVRRFFGVEIEVCFRSEFYRDRWVSHRHTDLETVYGFAVEKDSSLPEGTGAEIISPPWGLHEHQKGMTGIAYLFATLGKGIERSENCGLHVTCSLKNSVLHKTPNFMLRDMFNNFMGTLLREKATYANTFITYIAGRPANYYARRCIAGKYSAINTSKSGLLEFRFFRGATNAGEVLAAIEFADFLCGMFESVIDNGDGTINTNGVHDSEAYTSYLKSSKSIITQDKYPHAFQRIRGIRHDDITIVTK